jgi:protein TonB
MNMNNHSQPNRLLRTLVIVSAGIHFIILMHIAGIYNGKALVFIELTLDSFSGQQVRNIPRPRPRPREPSKVYDVSRPPVDNRPIYKMKQVKMDTISSDFSDELIEGIGEHEIPSVPGMAVNDWRGLMQSNFDEFQTANAYLEMVRYRIEKYKQYPSSAKAERREGRVTVRFIIRRNGSVEAVMVFKSSNNRMLDEAALEAVRKAGPFPPQRFFEEDVPIELSIVFELT